MQSFRAIMPDGPVGAYQTYQILAPASTHFRPATCAEVHCEAHVRGWVTVVDESTELGQRQAHFIRHDRSRRWRETRQTEGVLVSADAVAVIGLANLAGLTAFEFEAGQRCFRAGDHRTRVARPEIYVVRDGDWRGNPTGRRRRHANADDWVDDFAEHQDRIATAVERG